MAKKVIVAGHITMDVTPAFPTGASAAHHELLTPGKQTLDGAAAFHTGGAGDTSIAAFLAAMLEGYPPEDCVRLATAAGACCVEKHGALEGLVPLPVLRKRIADGWRKAVE